MFTKSPSCVREDGDHEDKYAKGAENEHGDPVLVETSGMHGRSRKMIETGDAWKTMSQAKMT
jgi:hypothetical protein